MAGLTAKEKNALKLFKERVHKAFPKQVKDVQLFGSKARGDAAKHSDVDVLVVLSSGKGDLSTRDPVYGIATDILLKTGVDLSPKVLTKAQYDKLRSWGEPLLLNIEREGIPL